jgi:hypothetical protein
MTIFQIVSILFSGIGLLSGIFLVYLKLKVDIAKIEMRLNGIDRELIQREISLLLIEKVNREDHKEIIKKIDDLVEIIMKK